MTTKFSKEDIKEATEFLTSILKPGDTVYTTVRHVSRSGMYRVINLHVIVDNKPVNIDWAASKLLEGYDDRHNGCRASGCGMDMGFHLVYNLSATLFRGGFQCTGGIEGVSNCPSNDHSNAPYPVRDGLRWHKEGGYALRQSWM